MIKKIDIKQFAESIHTQETGTALKVHYVSAISSIRSKQLKDSLSVILGNNLLQIIIGIYCYYNDESFQFSYFFPDNYTSIDLMSQSLVYDAPGIFNNIQLMYEPETKDIHSLRFKDISKSVKILYSNLVQKNKIDPYIVSLFKKNHRAYRGEEIETYYEITDKKIAIPLDDIVTNSFIMFLVSQCKSKSNNMAGIPLGGWSLEELGRLPVFRELNNLFKRVVFGGYGEPWMSITVMFVEPESYLLKYMENDFFDRGRM